MAKSKQKQSVESMPELLFPAKGIDLSNEFVEQPLGTTPEGENVRAFEPSSNRSRGGSRPGIERYIDAQVGGASSVIQHLNVIVDPTTEALPDVQWPDQSTGTADPSDPNRIWRPGGGGGQPNPNTTPSGMLLTCATSTGTVGTAYSSSIGVTGGTAPYDYRIIQGGLPPGLSMSSTTGAITGTPTQAGTFEYHPYITDANGKIRRRVCSIVVSGPVPAFVQATSSMKAIATPGSTQSYAFASPVTAGDLLFLVSFSGDTASSSYINTVTDTQGNTYTKVQSPSLGGAVWWAIASATGACTINAAYVVGAGTIYDKPVIGEYSGTHTTSPIGGIADNSGNSTSLTTTAISIAAIHAALVGYFLMSDIQPTAPPAFSPDAGFNERHDDLEGIVPFNERAVLADKIDVSANAAVSGTIGSAHVFTAIGFSLTPP